MERKKLLEVLGVSKRFGGTVALDNVDFDLYEGEVHGLVGENGAGKSTLMQILSGYHTQYDGSIIIKDEPVTFTSTRDALSKGIGMIYQELSVIGTLSVAENVFLGDPPTNKLGMVDWKSMSDQSYELLMRLGMKNIDVNRDLNHYTIAARQMIEIASVIFSGADIIIMDEPTSALSQNEVRSLFNFINVLKSQNKGIIFISHFLEDVLEVSDRITVLRNGKRVATVQAKDVNKQDLTLEVLGRNQIKADIRNVRKFGITDKSPVIQIDHLGLERHFNDINFRVYPGEFVGVFGSMGAGKTKLAETLFGLIKPDQGQIIFDGKPITLKNSKEAKELGIAYVPADRQSTLFSYNEIYKNITLTHLPSICPDIIRKTVEFSVAEEMINTLGIAPPDPTYFVHSLSGGNQQKVVLGKWLTKLPRLLLLNDPTRGMDVGAKQEVMEIIQNLRTENVASILFSSEPEFLLAYADFIIVLKRGNQLTQLQNKEASEELLQSYM